MNDIHQDFDAAIPNSDFTTGVVAERTNTNVVVIAKGRLSLPARLLRRPLLFVLAVAIRCRLISYERASSFYSDWAVRSLQISTDGQHWGSLRHGR